MGVERPDLGVQRLEVQIRWDLAVLESQRGLEDAGER